MGAPHDDVAGAARAHESLLGVLDGLDDATARRRSRLPGWTVGHVVTHLARNADGLRNMVVAAAQGDVGEMYPGGLEQRSADIEAGAARSAAELVADVRAASAALDESWATLYDAAWASGKGRGPFGDRDVRDLPFVRWREVQIHTVDLGLDAFGVDDWDSEYVRRELHRQVMSYRARQPMGLTQLPAAANALPPARRLAWLVGRLTVDGLGDPGPWS